MKKLLKHWFIQGLIVAVASGILLHLIIGENKTNEGEINTAYNNGTNNGNIIGKLEISTNPEPVVLETKFLSQENILDEYKISFLVTIGNPSDKINFHLDYPSSITKYDEPISMGTGNRRSENRNTLYQKFLFVFYSKTEIDPSKFKFSIKD